MDTTKVKRQLSRMNLEQLRNVQEYIKDRIRKIHAKARQERQEQAWAWAKALKPGDKVWCCAEGMFLGGSIQRGDQLTVYHIQPRKKVLWLKPDPNSRYYAFRIPSIVRYNFKSTPPADPMGPEERRMAKVGGKIVNEVLS